MRRTVASREGNEDSVISVENSRRERRSCYKCGKFGHHANQCDLPKEDVKEDVWVTQGQWEGHSRKGVDSVVPEKQEDGDR